MLRYIKKDKDGNDVFWKGERINGVKYSRRIEHKLSPDELETIGLELVTKAEPEPDPIDPLTQPISRMQFKAILRINNLLDSVATAIGEISDPVVQAVAMSKFEENDRYHRDDPLFAQLGSALELTSEQIDAMWLQALEIE